eukprot:PhM_4_TR5194/c0_g1_i2/m.46777
MSKKNITVCLRLRPPNQREKTNGSFLGTVRNDPFDNGKVRIQRTADAEERDVKEYKFHRVFPETSTQEDVYKEAARGAVEDAMQGYQGLVFVYGQTGTGKTHTLCNLAHGNEGILFRSVHELFEQIEKDAETYRYHVKVSFVQIYSEVVEDLLSNEPDSVVTLREDAHDSVELRGCCYQEVTTVEEALAAFRRGDRQRAVGDTSMNDKSSRSHCIFTLYISRSPMMTDTVYDSSEETVVESHGRLTLVDLAGSERAKKAGTDTVGREERLKEATFINRSLLTLGRVVHILTESSDSATTHVPFRDSKLTRLLQFSLSGKGRTTIIVTAGPSGEHYDETYAAIQFGQRAAKIRENAQKNEVVDWKAMALKYMALYEQGTDIAVKTALEAEKAEHERVVEELQSEIEMLRASTGGCGGAALREALMMSTAADENNSATVALTHDASSVPTSQDHLNALHVVKKLREQLADTNQRLSQANQRNCELAQYKQDCLQLASKLERFRADTDRMLAEADRDAEGQRRRIAELEGKCPPPSDVVQELYTLRNTNASLKSEVRKKERALLRLRDQAMVGGRPFSSAPADISGDALIRAKISNNSCVAKLEWDVHATPEAKLTVGLVVLHHENEYLRKRVLELQADVARHKSTTEKFRGLLKEKVRAGGGGSGGGAGNTSGPVTRRSHKSELSDEDNPSAGDDASTEH